MKYRLYLKRALSIIMISVMLSVSAGSAFSRGYDAKAASGVETLGGASLFEFLLGLFGVSVPALGASHRPGSPEALYQEYLETLQAAGADDALTMQEYMDLINGDTVSITSGVIDSVQDFLEGKFGSLSSGSIQNVYDGYVFDTFETHSSYTSSFINYVSSIQDNFFIVHVNNITPVTESYYCFVSSSLRDPLFAPDSSSFYFLNPDGTGGFDLTLVKYDSFGMPVSTRDSYFQRYRYTGSSWTSYGKPTFSNSVFFDTESLYSNLPIYVLGSHVSLGITSLSDVFSLISSSPDQAVSGVSFGGYSKSLINSVSGKVLSMDSLSASNTAVRSAVEMNTLEDEETGVITYTDAIAGAVSDAIARALADAGVIEGDITKPGTGEGEGEEEEKPLPVVPDGLMDLLKNMGDAIVDGFSRVGEWIMDIPEAIGGFFVSLWEWLQKIWEAICALPGQIADAFKDFFSPGESDTPGESGDPPDNAPFLADLSSLFPFCVPFDLIRLFKVLESAPQAPYWEIPFDVPSIGLHYEFVIDMSQFDTLAQIFRACETIGFICGLILITRKLIRG